MLPLTASALLSAVEHVPLSPIHPPSLQVINQLKMLSAQSKQTSTAALEQSRPSHRRSASESSGGARGRAAGGSGDRGSPSAGRKHAAHSLMTLAQLHKRPAVSKVCVLGSRCGCCRCCCCCVRDFVVSAFLASARLRCFVCCGRKGA